MARSGLRSTADESGRSAVDRRRRETVPAASVISPGLGGGLQGTPVDSRGLGRVTEA